MSITVRLSEQQLLAAGACASASSSDHWSHCLRFAIAEQNDLRARRGRAALPHLRFRVTPLHLLWLAASRPGDYAWAVAKGILPGLALAGANLDGANLAGANLARASLDGASLDGASLDGANLARASLAGASLDGASLDGANLARANLARASLAGANLADANLDGASLDGANLVGANLVGASLVGASLVGAYRGSASAIDGWIVDVHGYLRRRP